MSAPEVERAIERLTGLLPLARRQRDLPPAWIEIHRWILNSLAGRGRAPGRAEIARWLGDTEADALLERLAADDLVVLDASGDGIAGAYPMTTEQTPHRLDVNGQAVHAMCAVDALSVAPLFGARVGIDSLCHLTGEALHIRQSGERLLETVPSAAIRVGVRWQDPRACAAHSLCREMVFLRDGASAREWCRGDPGHVSLFTLPEAVAFGAGFFMPLLRG